MFTSLNFWRYATPSNTIKSTWVSFHFFKRQTKCMDQFFATRHYYYIGGTYTKIPSLIFFFHKDGKIDKWYHYDYTIWEWVIVQDMRNVQGLILYRAIKLQEGWLSDHLMGCASWNLGQCQPKSAVALEKHGGLSGGFWFPISHYWIDMKSPWYTWDVRAASSRSYLGNWKRS